MGLFDSLKSIKEDIYISKNPLFNISIDDAQLLQKIVENLGFAVKQLLVGDAHNVMTLEGYLRRGADPDVPVEVAFEFEGYENSRNVAIHARAFQAGIWTGYRSLYMDLHQGASTEDITFSVFKQIPQINSVFKEFVEDIALRGII